MIRHYRTYPDTDDWADALIGYSAAGYDTGTVLPVQVAPVPRSVRSKHLPYLRLLAATGAPFTVRAYAAHFGVAKQGQQLYTTLAALVAAGELTRTVGKGGIGIYQGRTP
jgi:hypothetical protein